MSAFRKSLVRRRVGNRRLQDGGLWVALVLLGLSSANAQSVSPPRLLADTVPGSVGGAGFQRAIAGERAVFSVQDGTPSFELWGSDGTGVGTERLPTQSSSWRAVFGGANRLYFILDSNDLWATDGTPQGTEMVLPNLDLAPGAPLFSAVDYSEILDVEFFAHNDGAHGSEVWASRGTEASTQLLVDANPGSGDSIFGPVFSLNGKVYFVTGTIVSGQVEQQLWETDGSVQGTSAKDIQPMPSDFLEQDGFGYYFAVDPATDLNGLWRTDGSSGAAQQILPGLPASTAPFSVGDDIYYWYFDGAEQQLWNLELSPARTTLISGFSGQSGPVAITVGDWLLIGENNNQSRLENLWGLQSPAAGLEPLLDCLPDCSTFLNLNVVSENEFFFSLEDPILGNELWRSNGTKEGTRLVIDACPGTCGSGIFPFHLGSDRFFFGQETVDFDNQIFSDPAIFKLEQTGGQPTLESLTSGLNNVGFVVPLKDNIFFLADDGVHGREPHAIEVQQPKPCEAAANVLCLGANRFAVEVEWTDFQGGSGQGNANSLTDDSGSFWFFDQANLELIVKVIDGTAINGHHWVFFGSLSNVGYSLTVTDTETGKQARYDNEPGTFGSMGDTQALPASGSEVVPTSVRHATEPVVPAASNDTISSASSTCGTTTQVLCLGDRFELSVNWTDFQGGKGQGNTLEMTQDTGGFWFFDSENVELVIKVLDGRPVNGKFWVFYGALSDVEYELTVTDTMDGTSKVYRNPSGRFASVGDTSAF